MIDVYNDLVEFSVNYQALKDLAFRYGLYVYFYMPHTYYLKSQYTYYVICLQTVY